MQSQIPLYPEEASNFAPHVDALMIFITAVCLFFAVAVTAAVIFFVFKYRRKEAHEIGVPIHGDMRLETAWIVVPLILALAMFGWGAIVYVDYRHAPSDALDIYVIGKQWMWKLQQPNGQREINELHVPVGVPVKLTMTSEDVIHDFYIPAFRVKKDVIPGRYSSLWFQATKIGTYHLFCAQYCGADHAEMLGWVYVMSPADYAAWLAGGSSSQSMQQAGETIFNKLGCASCHLSDGTGRGPSLVGIYGKEEALKSGDKRLVDEAFIRHAIVNPNSVVLPQYPAIMPTFQGQINEEQVLQLVAYVKSLAPEERKTEGK